MHTMESNLSNFAIQYLVEIKTEFENTLSYLSGAQIGSNHEKNGGQKAHDTDTLPLMWISAVSSPSIMQIYQMGQSKTFHVVITSLLTQH